MISEGYGAFCYSEYQPGKGSFFQLVEGDSIPLYGGGRVDGGAELIKFSSEVHSGAIRRDLGPGDDRVSILKNNLVFREDQSRRTEGVEFAAGGEAARPRINSSFADIKDDFLRVLAGEQSLWEGVGHRAGAVLGRCLQNSVQPVVDSRPGRIEDPGPGTADGLVVGAGDTGRLVARALCDAGAREIVVINRTEWRAEDLAKELGGISASFDRLDSELVLADVVISSTGSPGFIIEENTLSKAAAERHDRPLLLIDIAVPRDIDPEVRHLDGITLYDIDNLQDLSETSSTNLQQDIEWAESMVEQETASFQEWRQSLDLVPLITSIRDKAELMRNEEINRTIKKLESLDSPDTETLNEQLQLMTKSLVNKILHDPTIFLKESRDPSRQQIARDFFNLDGRNRRRGTK